VRYCACVVLNKSVEGKSCELSWKSEKVGVSKWAEDIRNYNAG
jgi:hypothetical protein